MLKTITISPLPKGSCKNINLSNKCIDQEGEAKGRPSSRFDDGHKVTKSNKHHNSNILEPWIVR
jgi:hypothetical protein